MAAKLWYSASVDDLEIEAYFLDIHETRLPLKQMQKLVVDLLLLGSKPRKGWGWNGAKGEVCKMKWLVSISISVWQLANDFGVVYA